MFEQALDAGVVRLDVGDLSVDLELVQAPHQPVEGGRAGHHGERLGLDDLPGGSLVRPRRRRVAQNLAQLRRGIAAQHDADAARKERKREGHVATTLERLGRSADQQVDLSLLESGKPILGRDGNPLHFLQIGHPRVPLGGFDDQIAQVHGVAGRLPDASLQENGRVSAR